MKRSVEFSFGSREDAKQKFISNDDERFFNEIFYHSPKSLNIKNVTALYPEIHRIEIQNMELSIETIQQLLIDWKSIGTKQLHEIHICPDYKTRTNQWCVENLKDEFMDIMNKMDFAGFMYVDLELKHLIMSDCDKLSIVRDALHEIGNVYVKDNEVLSLMNQLLENQLFGKEIAEQKDNGELSKLNNEFFKEQKSVFINWNGLKLFQLFWEFYDRDRNWINMKNLHRVYPNCVSIEIQGIDTNDILFEEVLNYLQNDRGKIQRIQFDSPIDESINIEDMVQKYDEVFSKIKWTFKCHKRTLYFQWVIKDPALEKYVLSDEEKELEDFF